MNRAFEKELSRALAAEPDTAVPETLLRRCMENAASLRVPLIADVHSGRSWYDTK